MTLDEAIKQQQLRIKRATRHIKSGNRVGRNQEAKAEAERILKVLNDVKALPIIGEGDYSF